MKEQKFTMFSNYDTDNILSREEFEEWYAEEFGGDETPNDNDYWNEYYERERMYYEDMENELDSIEGSCLIFGHVGRWNGTFEIEPDYKDNVLDAVKKCIDDCDYFSVEFENGVINVSSSHHDGTNHFTIRKLSDKGERIYENGNVTEFKDYCFRKFKVK